MSQTRIEKSGPLRQTRKGTRSCWECRRRKTRCQYSSNDSICDWCLSHDKRCLSQQYPDPHDESCTPNGRSLHDRMARVEQLLEKLLEKIEPGNPPRFSPSYDPRSSSEINSEADVLDQSSVVGNHNTHVLSLFDNRVFHRSVSVDCHTREELVNHSSNGSSGNGVDSIAKTGKMAEVSSLLLSQMPSQRTIEFLNDASADWFAQVFAHPFPLHLDDNFTLLNTVSSDWSSSTHPSLIAKGLICISLCLGQFPVDHEESSLQLSSPPRIQAELLSSTVTRLVTSDDEMVVTYGGLECLSLQSLYLLNSGRPRKAWLCIQRALGVAQLLGLHHAARSSTGTDAPPQNNQARLWLKLIHFDHLLASILGFKRSVQDYFSTRLDDLGELAGADLDMSILRRMDTIAAHIIDRDQSGSTLDFAIAQTINAEVGCLAREIPQPWWEVPKVLPTPGSHIMCLYYQRLSLQIWFFQLKILLHLPFMLQSTEDHDYAYSRFCCLKASSELLGRYILLRNTPGIFCCCLTNFQAFIAAVVQILYLLSPAGEIAGQTSNENPALRWSLVSQVIEKLEEAKARFGDPVALQSLETLKSLQSFQSDLQNDHGNLRLTIPYFGTVYTRRAGSRNTNSNVYNNNDVRHKPDGYEARNAQESLPEPINSPSVYLTTDGFTRPIPPDPDELLSDWFTGTDDWLQYWDTPNTL